LRTRIAPTPSGFLHIGNAYSFLLTWLVARAADGELVLRIDDMDSERIRPEYIQDIFESLNWLGITYDIGPRSPDEFESQYSQRHRLPLYESALGVLIEKHFVFACECSRSRLSRAGAKSYPDFCREKNIPIDQPHVALRLTVPLNTCVFVMDAGKEIEFDLSAQIGSFIVRRRDGKPAYHLTSVIDDLHFGINTIVRGEDLFESTAAQLYLSDKLGIGSFAQSTFLHHALISNEQGQKLSKSAGASSLKAMRALGARRNSLLGEFAKWLGLPESHYEMPDDLLSGFTQRSGKGIQSFRSSTKGLSHPYQS